MNTEFDKSRLNKQNENAQSWELTVPEIDLSKFITKNYLSSYLSENTNNPFMQPEMAKELKTAIPILLKNVLDSTVTALGEKAELIMGGTAAEVAAPLLVQEDYWGTKQCFIRAAKNKKVEIEKSGEDIREIINILAYGDPDIDLYTNKKENIEKIFTEIWKTYEKPQLEENKSSDGKISKTSFKTKVSESLSLFGTMGPVSSSNPTKKFNLRLIDANGKSFFHIDVTPKDQFEVEDDLVDRRTLGGVSIHNLCRAYIDAETGFFKVNTNIIPRSYIPSEIKNKDVEIIIESLFREVRKKISHAVLTHGNEKGNAFTLSQLFPFLGYETMFYLKEITSNLNKNIGEKTLREKWKSQKKVCMREFFLIAQLDPYMAMNFLKDTGLDNVFFDRHFSKEEYIDILNSIHPTYAPIEYRTQNNLFTILDDSREKYLKLSHIDKSKCDGFVNLISAIGKVCGPEEEKGQTKKHFSTGLRLFQNGKLPEWNYSPIEMTKMDNAQKEMYDVIESWGGITETSLHHILNKNNPKQYPSDKELFGKAFLELKLSGLIESEKRKILIGKEPIDVYEYYPARSSNKLYKLLPEYRNKEGKLLDNKDPEYWQFVLRNEQGTYTFADSVRLSSVNPRELAFAWRIISQEEDKIDSLEVLQNIRKKDWRWIQEDRGDLIIAIIDDLRTEKMIDDDDAKRFTTEGANFTNFEFIANILSARKNSLEFKGADKFFDIEVDSDL